MRPASFESRRVGRGGGTGAPETRVARSRRKPPWRQLNADDNDDDDNDDDEDDDVGKKEKKDSAIKKNLYRLF